MSETVQTASIVGAETGSPDDLDVGLAISPVDIGERLWRFFISMRTGLVLILALALLGLVGTLLVQAPGGLRGDPQAYATWLQSLRPKYGGWTGILDTLGLFSVFSSVWFRGIMVLLTTSVLACSLNRAPHLWRLTVHPRTDMSESFFAHVPLRTQATGSLELEAAAAEVESAFRRHHFRTLVRAEGDQIHLYADHFRWGPFGTVIAHLSLVVILIGALVGSAFGFRNDGFAVAVGSRVEVGNGTGLSVEAKSFSDSYYTNGAPSDYASELIAYKDGLQVGAATVRVNQPMRIGDVSLYQSYFGAAAAMKVADASGKVIAEQGVPLEWASNDGTRVVGLLALPATGLNMYVLAPRSGEIDPEIKPGQMQIELYRAGSEGTALASQIVNQGQPVAIAGLTVTFLRERQFTGLIVARDPGALFIWLGTILLVGGITLVFFFPCRRVWALVRRRPGGTTVQAGAVIRHDVGFEAEFRRIGVEIELALVGHPQAQGRVG